MSNVLLTLAILKWLQLDKLIPYTFCVHFSETKPSCAGARFVDTPICSCFVHICVPFQQVGSVHAKTTKVCRWKKNEKFK